MAYRRLTTTGYAPDDNYLVITRQDKSGGVNTRQFSSQIKENEVEQLENVDIGVFGERSVRPGLTNVGTANASLPIVGLFGFEPRGGTFKLLGLAGTGLSVWNNTASFASPIKNDFTTGLDTKMVKVGQTGDGDVVAISNGTDNVFIMKQDNTFIDCLDTNTSPPKTTAITYYRNRLWALKANQLYFSSAVPATYSLAFDRTTNVYNIPTGTERALIGAREYGLVCFGADQIWGINPSTTPAATDKPEALVTEHGCVANETVAESGDDYYYMANDGVRSLKRTIFDKLQQGVSYPLSYYEKDEFDLINWAAITKACGVYFDNKYFISLPTSGSTYNNRVWVYFPASKGWAFISGWNISKWAKFKLNGEERLYAGHSTGAGYVYRAWSGATDDGTAITMTETGRNEDMGKPAQKKVGGEVKLEALSTGDYDITVRASFDNGGFNTLGTMNLAGNLVTFPVTFPVLFGLAGTSYKKFHLDSYGEWYRIQLQFEVTDEMNSESDVTILNETIATHTSEYDSEEEV